MTSRIARSTKSRARVRHAGRDYVIVPASEFPRWRGTGREVYFDAIEFANWSIGRDLRRLRRKAGLSQAQVARRAKMRPETISRLENGHGNPTVATVRKILRALGVPAGS